MLITQAIGKMSYKFDDGTVHTIGPGDSIFIPKGVYQPTNNSWSPCYSKSNDCGVTHSSWLSGRALTVNWSLVRSQES